MSTNMEKLKRAGIVGQPHTIAPEHEEAVESLTEQEVDTLIAVKAKLEQKKGPAIQEAGKEFRKPLPMFTVSF